MSEEIKNVRPVHQKTFLGVSFSQTHIKGHKQKNRAHGGKGIVLVPIKIPDNIDKETGDMGNLIKFIIKFRTKLITEHFTSKICEAK
jgi:hypothetical protein